ncbi:MAG: ABC transporter ATP-binding protein [Myxococcota bacterium]|nr:ABC transporter ATP-binding protein [Myxococcota bacterium]
MIEVQSLSRYYGTHRAVADVSFTIGENTVVGFLGLNGAGKTTTLKVIAGLLTPSAGSVRIDGVDMTSASVDFRKRIGFLPETPPLYTEMTVTDFLRHVGQVRGMSAAEVGQRIPEVVAKCQLSGQEHRVIDELSHGFRKRVGIAQAIIHRPKLVILDEPISGLDPIQIVEMRRVIQGLAAECTVLVSSHILGEISQTCHRILVLTDGRLVADGTEAELARRFNTGTGLLITLTAEEPAVRSFFEGRDGVVSHDVTRAEDGRVELRVELAADAREQLVADIVEAGFGLRRLEDAQDELEEIFMDLTRGGAE